MSITLYVEPSSGRGTHVVGERPKCTAYFRRLVSGVATLYDPPSVIAKVRTPLGVETELEFGVDVELVKESTGVYSFPVLLDEASVPAAPGATPPVPFPVDWFVRVVADPDALERRIHVRASNFTSPFPGGAPNPFAMFDGGEAMSDNGQPMTDGP